MKLQNPIDVSSPTPKALPVPKGMRTARADLPTVATEPSDRIEALPRFSLEKLPPVAAAPAPAPTWTTAPGSADRAAPTAAAQSAKYLAKATIGLSTLAAGTAAYAAVTGALAGNPVLGVGAAAAAMWVALVKTKDTLLGLRSDGTLVKNATVMRRFMPYLMPTRESARIDYQQNLKLGRAQAFVADWNAKNSDPELQITVFHVILAAMQRANLLHPGLNRFVIGKRLFARNDYSVGFVVKSEKKAHGSLRTVKLRGIPGEDFAGYVRRINRAIHAERSVRRANATEREMMLLEHLPRPVLSMAMRARDILDAEGLWFKSWIDPDPMYASVFVANLGSLDKEEMPNVKHHLYECGTTSLFATLCSIDESGPEPSMLVNWTYDERVNDAHGCLAPLKAMRAAVLSPEVLLETVTPDQIAAALDGDKAAGDHALAKENAN